MRSSLVLSVLSVAAVLAAASGGGTASLAGASSSPVACVPAVISGKHHCLRVGQRCQKRLDRQYHRYGFHCHSGRLTRAARPKPPPAPPASPPALPNVLATLPVPGDGTIEAGDGQVWVANVEGESIMRIDPSTARVVATVAARSGRPGYYGIGLGEGAVWLSNYVDNTVARLDPSDGALTAVVPVGEQPEGIAAAAGAVWVANHHGGSVSHIDPTTNRVVATVSVGPAGDGGPHDITAAAGSIWTVVPNLGAVVRIDPETNRVLATIHVTGGACRVVAGAADAVWVAGGACGGALTRIDPATNTVVTELRSSELGGQAAGVAIVDDSVWVAVRPGRVVRVDRATGRIAARFATSGEPQAIAFADGSLWLRKIGEVLRVQP
jgi:virginiamycin B lyase